jgi:hypothetical protein
MNKPVGYIGRQAIVWEDGERNTFDISQIKGQIQIGEHLVSMRNHKNFQGVLREISEVMSNPPRKIKSYNWLELNRQLVYKDD